MLPQERVVDNGLKCLTELGDMRTLLRAHAGDLDVTGAYPSNGQALNISKETTSKEITSIEDVDDNTARMMTLNISAGRTNAIEIAQHLFGLPGLDDWAQAFEEDCARQDAAALT